VTFTEKLDAASSRRKSLLCIGLDLDPSKLPSGYSPDAEGVFSFGRGIIEATKDLAAAYKPNSAFFEAMGLPGLSVLERLIKTVPADIPVILDAKRGDIGNTSAKYAEAVFDRFGADAVTVSPYMGRDSLEPFFNRKDRHVFVLVLTSNPGAADFEMLDCAGEPLYMRVAAKVRSWNATGNLGAVVGATRPADLERIRTVLTEEIFLIPGLGAQGGDLAASVRGALSGRGRALFNVSRDIVFAGSFDLVRAKAEEYRKAIEEARS
jgi:orotidine-5'-phosphate decarboxylase